LVNGSTATLPRSKIVAAVDQLRHDYEAFGFSFATLAREAARRGNPELLKLHIYQTKTALDPAFEVEAELGLPKAEPVA
jgi:hypothetical protein